MLIIVSWNGRTGNNILQMIRSIHYAILHNHNIIQFQSHPLLNSNKISLEYKQDNCELLINDTFFSLKKYNIIDPEPYVMRDYFQKYIKPIFNIQLDKQSFHDDNMLYIHFRGGDIFCNSPHTAYVQPPLSYYKNIMKDYDNVTLVCEDRKNPCVNELLKQTNVDYISNTIEQDLNVLSNIPNLVVGFGTFGFLLYLMNINLKNLYIPGYFANELPKGDWGNDIKVHVINLPNYIKVGDWKNSVEQRQIMLEYP